MNGSRESIVSLIGGLLKMDGSSSEVVVAPSFPYLSQVNDLIDGGSVMLAAQNVSHELKGAYTGEGVCFYVGDFGVKYVLLGHSERRSLYSETDDIVASK